MRILYVGMKYDYGKPEQGTSFEHNNFFDSLHHTGHDLLYFDFLTLMQRHGREAMNRRLEEVARAEKPDLMFTILYQDQLTPETLRRITERGDTITVNWFCDDHWRFESFSRRYAPCFRWVVTTAQSALPKYQAMGYESVIKSQWACNHFQYRRLDAPLDLDVTFIGQPHGNRREILGDLQAQGVPVQAWGSGWENGRLTQEEMIAVFCRSRINLNLPNASTPVLTGGAKVKQAVRVAAVRALNSVPFGAQVKAAVKQRAGEARRSQGGTGLAEAVAPKLAEQIKGRNFEIPGCGGFLLTGPADNLSDYYEDGKEIVCFEDTRDLAEKARYYLSHEDERRAIAEAGYQRTLREHTYAHRFTEIFHRIGLSAPPVDALMPPRVGHVEEIE